jgi:transketolase
VTLRCYEQIKVAIASMFLPMTIIGNGVGYSYNDAGPTHYATEDISCMRALGGIEILTASDTETVLQTAKLTYTKPAFRYVRLDRAFLPDIYPSGDKRFMRDGLVEIEPGEKACIIASGIATHIAKEVRTMLAEQGHKVAIIDAFRIKPIDGAVLKRVLAPYSKIITLEEHFLSGGMGGAIVEAMADAQILKPVKRIGIADQYILENGGRGYIQSLAGVDAKSAAKTAAEFLR